MAFTFSQLRTMWAGIFSNDAPAESLLPEVDLETRNDLLDTLEEQFTAVNTAIANVPVPSYLAYAASISQTGAGAPVPVIRDSGFGAIAWYRTDAGTYEGFLNNAFVPGTVCAPVALWAPDGRKAIMQVRDTDYIDLLTFNAAGILADSILDNAFIEIRIYN